jgi:hypothetical protein
LQWNFAKFFAMAADKLGMPSPHSRADAREHSALTAKDYGRGRSWRVSISASRRSKARCINRRMVLMARQDERLIAIERRAARFEEAPPYR